MVDIDAVARDTECDKAIELGSQVMLIGGASAYPATSAVMADLLQLGRPDATPRPPAPAEAAPLTTLLSQLRNRIGHCNLRDASALLDLLLLVANGQSNQEIAKALFISETTVKTHIAHTLAKLGARDRIQLAVLAHQNGLT